MSHPGAHVSDRWAQWRRDIPLDAYHLRFAQMEAEGRSSHGEADFIDGFRPASILDAGCGMGRVAIELHQRGYDVEGVDLDGDLLAYARRDAPHVQCAGSQRRQRSGPGQALRGAEHGRPPDDLEGGEIHEQPAARAAHDGSTARRHSGLASSSCTVPR